MNTAGSPTTSIGTITSDAVIARIGIIHKLTAADRITAVGCTSIAVVTSQRATWLAITGYTCLCAVTDIVVVALAVVLTDLTLAGGKVTGRITGTVVNIVAAIGRLVAAIGGTTHAIAAVGRRAALASQGSMTGLGSIAPLAVVAGSIIGHVITTIGRLVAAIGGTTHAIAAVGRRAVLASQGCMASLGPIAPLAVITVGVGITLTIIRTVRMVLTILTISITATGVIVLIADANRTRIIIKLTDTSTTYLRSVAEELIVTRFTIVRIATGSITANIVGTRISIKAITVE
jgi:hypothetical protein